MGEEAGKKKRDTAKECGRRTKKVGVTYGRSEKSIVDQAGKTVKPKNRCRSQGGTTTP